MARQHLNATAARGLDKVGTDLITRVCNGGNPAVSVRQIEGGIPGTVVAGHHGGAITHLHAIAVQVGLCSACQHDARAVVSVKDQRLFQRALRQHDLTGANPPHPLTRGILGGLVQMVGQPLGQTNHVLMIIADGRCPRHQRDTRRTQLRKLPGEPGPGAQTLDLHGRIGEKRTTHFGVLVHQHDLGAGLRGGQRCRDTGRTAANDQHIRMQIARGIIVRIRLGRRLAEAGGRADEGLVDLVPEAARPHEGLVVEARGKEHVGAVVHRPDVELQRRPLVLAFRHKPLAQLLHGGAGVRLEPARSTRCADQRVRLFGTGTHRSARTVILEGTAHQMHAIGQQRRRNRITAKTFITAAVKREADRLGRICPAQAGDAIAAHSTPSSSVSAGRSSPAL